MMPCEQIFILGAPRSGTTFLSLLLKSTSFGSPVETHFITKYQKRLGSYGNIHDRTSFRKLVNNIFSERAVKQWNLKVNADELFEELPSNFSYGDIVNAIMLRKSCVHGRFGWGDKTPHYLKDLDILVSLFPRAKFIYIVRDGRDVALSLLEKPWGPNNIYKCAGYWSELNSKLYIIDNLRSQNRLHSLKYEDLLQDTRSNIQKIYEFLGEAITEDEIRSLSESTKAENFDKWKTQMTKRQIRVFESVSHNELLYFGYTLLNTKPKVFPIEKLYFNMHDSLCKARFLFHTNVIDGFKIKFLGKQPFNE